MDTGDQLWSAPSPDPELDALDILVMSDGTLLALGQTWALATNPSTHSFLWRLSPGGDALGQPVEIPYDAVRSSVLGDDGVLYLSMFDARPDGRGGILAVDPVSGEVKWSYITTGPAGATAPKHLQGDEFWPVLVVDHAEGASMHEWARTASVRERVDAFGQLAAALAELEKAQISHGDLWGPNVIVSAAGNRPP